MMDAGLCRIWKITLFGFLLYTFSTLGLRADVRLPSLISDGMVLQQGTKVNIWGTADPGERVTVTFNNQHVAGIADGEGRWKVVLGPLSAGGPYKMTIAGKNTLTLLDVLVGEVWICSGQSNMEMYVAPSEVFGWKMPGVDNYQHELSDADYPVMHLFTVGKTWASKPQRDVKGYWVAARPETVAEFSAVGYFFGRQLLKTLNVPIGIIDSSRGASPAEAWTSRETLESDPNFASILAKEKQLVASYPKALEDFEQQFAKWKEVSQKAEMAGELAPESPAIPAHPTTNSSRPAYLFNGMIAPLTSYAIKGVIWYQGESNADRPVQYRKLFPAMIRDWRQAWGNGDFPFLFVQLASWGAVPPTLNFPELREAQLMTLSVPKTAMAVTIDIGDAIDVHAKNKQELGYRLALAAQAIAYGREVAYSGPLYASKAIEGGKIRLRFEHVYGGLVTKPWAAPTVYSRTPFGFEIAGEDRKFVPAQATVEGKDTVVVWSGDVAHPVAVRYAWGMNPICNLYNQVGLPASPFRTEEW
jgi:sialate O-acetylesterase